MGPLLFPGKTFQRDQQSDKPEQRKRKLCGCRGIGSTEPEVINPGGESRHRKKLDGAEIGRFRHRPAFFGAYFHHRDLSPLVRYCQCPGSRTAFSFSARVCRIADRAGTFFQETATVPWKCLISKTFQTEGIAPALCFFGTGVLCDSCFVRIPASRLDVAPMELAESPWMGLHAFFK